MLAIVALHVFPAAIFAFIHGAILYRVRGILIFFLICLAVGNLFENVGILTGFPFGTYYFTDVMGPTLFRVPILLGLAYVGMGYLSWTLARLILGQPRAPLIGYRLMTLPLIAALIMVAWDLSMDPVWSTLMHAWIWLGGGAYFGVPVSNFLGWYLTVFVIYQLFALYLRSRPLTTRSLPVAYWRLPILFYAVSALGNVLLIVPASGPMVISDPTGAFWKVTDITRACASASIFIMGAFAMLAWVRLAGEAAAINSSVSSS